jgi:hypothetical protein
LTLTDTRCQAGAAGHLEAIDTQRDVLGGWNAPTIFEPTEAK